MLNSVNHFFVGQANQIKNAVGPVYNTAAEASQGDIGIIYPYNDVIFLATDIAKGKKGFRIGQKISSGTDGKWRYSPVITPTAVRKALGDYSTGQGTLALTAADLYTDNAAPVARSIKFTNTAGSVTVGNTIYLEIVYKNVRDLSPQFRYDVYQCVVGGSTTTIGQINTNFKNQIEKDPMAKDKLSVTISGGSSEEFTIAAKFPPYSANQRYEWQSIDFDASFSYTPPTTSIANTPAARLAWGVVTTDTPGKDGVGYYPIVADQEKRALAYQGLTNWTAFPVNLPDMYAKPAPAIYDCLRIPFSTQYRSADNITGKGTNELLTIYIDHPTSGTPQTAAETFKTQLLSVCNY